MSQQRIDYREQSPELFSKLVEFSMLVAKSGIEPAIQDLVSIRASQLNGCAFCIDMHSKAATIHGERPLRLYHLATWRESTLFEPRERAALAWTEALTSLPPQGVPQEMLHGVIRRSCIISADRTDGFSLKQIQKFNHRTQPTHSRHWL